MTTVVGIVRDVLLPKGTRSWCSTRMLQLFNSRASVVVSKSDMGYENQCISRRIRDLFLCGGGAERKIATVLFWATILQNKIATPTAIHDAARRGNTTENKNVLRNASSQSEAVLPCCYSFAYVEKIGAIKSRCPWRWSRMREMERSVDSTGPASWCDEWKTDSSYVEEELEAK